MTTSSLPSPLSPQVAAAAVATLLALATGPAAQQPVRCKTPPPDPTHAVPEVPGDCAYSSTNPTSEYAPTFVYRIPVVVHVITTTSGVGNLSAAQVQSQIDILNEDFRAKAGTPGAQGFDTKIEFYLATTDPSGKPTTGITYSANNTWFNDGGSYWTTLAWDTNRYLNIYTNNGGGALGYVPDIPQAGNLVGRTHDRVVIDWSTFGRNAPQYPYNMGRTTTHEVGHWLGLWHTFDNGCGQVSNCYRTGDFICDTQPEAQPNYSCAGQSTCGDPDPWHNYLDYTDDRCMWQLTSEQTRRMRCTLKNWRPNAWTICASAGVSSRTAGANPASYTATLPVLGSTCTGTIDLATTGHTTAGLFGFTRAGTLAMGAYVVLLDPTSGLLLNLTGASGPKAKLAFPIPNDPNLCGVTIYTQAAHYGGAPGLVLSNALDLTLGSQ